MRFTKEEISLCKQIAGKHKKEIEYGDWYLSNTVTLLNKFIHGTINMARQVRLCLIPLWTIEDCFEFLGEQFNKLKRCKTIFEVELKFLGGRNWHEGKTPLEACLKAVLAVLEEK